jgi:transposase
MYVGLDLHKRVAYGTVIDENGKKLKESKIPMSIDAITSFLDGINTKIVFESGYKYQHLYDVLDEHGYDVTVANPLMVKAIAYAKVKSDKVDSNTLAHLLRANMIPECYVPDRQRRNLRDIVRRRHYLVNERTRFKNKIHAELSKRWVEYDRDLFSVSGIEFLKSLHIQAIDDYLYVIAFLNKKIHELDEQIEELANNDSYARLLISIPGISYFSALLISSEIGDINRFADYEKLCSYSGLVPKVHESGGKSINMHISKQGSKMLRWVLVQCVHIHVRNCDSSITRYFKRMQVRKGTKIAVIASARKLLKCIYMMLKEDRTFRLDG